jgi:hypothetical protein
MARTEEMVEQIAQDPFSTNMYFSESQRQLISVDQMAMPYARNVLVKLLREYPDDFIGSVLHQTLYQKLRPAPAELLSLLRGTGAASYFCPHVADEKKAREKFYKLSKRVGRPIHTHKNGDFIEATMEPDEVNISVRRK